jgi:hypothetical protein
MNRSAESTTAVTKRRWLPRFSLRTFFVLICLVGVALGCLGRFWHGVQHQRRLVAMIEQANGQIGYDYEFGLGDELGTPERDALWTIHTTNDDGFQERTFVTDAGEIAEVETPPGPKFIRELLGNDVFSSVELISFGWEGSPGELDPRLLLELPHLKVVVLSGPQVSDVWLNYVVQIPELHGLALLGNEKGPSPAALSRLQFLKKLRWIRLDGAWVTDDSVACVANLSQLNSLSLRSPNVTPGIFASIGQLAELRQLDLAGMEHLGDDETEHLGKLSKLQWLQAVNTSIADRTVAHLAGLTELEELDLAGTKVGDQGMEYLAGLPELDHLDVAGTRVTDAGLASLSRLPKLHYLRLTGLDITDAGTPALASMKQLATLDLALTLITDDGLMNLRELKRLKRLDVGPNVTEAAGDGLGKALPDCEVMVSSQPRK